ncbi:hypothetical protein FEM48_Zijuj06G0071500 [Ziziphus jujuba var. spinosa]|uniref:Serpin domain-containing protein n=1 Tax=Ziziphus jujuba var. spinosa TaxID=714518 RepID=A0A978V7W2_ZIZJJ|nr:hypothetical protein FEM48_Zijuj06G0071500 [Ziziphus jujuba var. spinosa]
MDLRKSIRNQNDVSLSITKRLLLTEGKDSNVVYSPLSLHVLLGVVFADGSPSGGPRLSFANGLWVGKSLPLKPSFKQVVDTAYRAALNQADFQNEAPEVIREVNSWVEKETSGLIREVLPDGSVNSTTVLIFADALYFKGAWNEPFDALSIKDHDFHLLNGSTVKAPFMTGTKTADAKDGLPALVEKLGSESGLLERYLPYERVEGGDFRIPRFKISFRFEASKTLKGLGLSFIEVNEEGTEAAAASAVLIATTSLIISEKIEFVADHPFLFVIREDMGGTILFTGHVIDPLAG